MRRTTKTGAEKRENRAGPQPEMRLGEGAGSGKGGESAG
jgi:hypothetical protein